MAKKSVIAGEYIIEIADNGSVEVMRVPSNLYQTMLGIAKEKDFPVDEKWNTQDLGRRLVKEFGDGKEAHFGDVVVKRLPTQQIEIYEECGHGNVKPELRAISDKMGFPYDKSWNTQTFGSKLVDYLLENKEKADKVLQTKRGSRTSDAAVADPSSSVIKLTVNREKSETIELSVIATGEVTIEGVEEPLQADGKSHDYTFTADEVVICGAVTDFICRSWPRTGMTHLDLSGCPTLTSLDCRGLLAEELDLSKLVDLTKLSIDRCQQLTSLDLTKLVNLTELSLSFCNELASLDLSKCVNLTKLSLESCSELASLDLSKLVNLTELSLDYCRELASLDLSKLVNLTKLSLESCDQVPSLDLSSHVNLTKLSLKSCDQLPSLDLTKLVNLTELSLDPFDKFASLDLSKFVNLTKLSLDSCGQLASLDLTKLVNLTELSIKSCAQLPSLDLTKLVNLTKLYLSPSTRTYGKPDAQLTSLDLSKCVNLTALSLERCNKLTSLDLSKNINLTKLSITFSDQLPSLDLSKLVNLTELSIERCDQLASLDLSKLVNLTELSITSSDQLPSLDLTKNINLTKLSITSSDQLPSLDLSKCVNLTKLSLDACDQLVSLDLSKCVNLTDIDLWGCSQLSSLEFSKCVNLTALTIKDCGQLTSFDFSKFVNLTYLSISSFDELPSLDLSKLVNLTQLSIESCKQLASVDVSGSKNLKYLELSECDSLDLIRCHTEAAPNLGLENVVQKEEGDVTLIMSEEYAEKGQADSQESTEVRQANPDDCPYELMIYSKRPIRATEIFTFDERTDEVDQIEELIKSGDTMELWENYYGEGKLFAILDLWGGDEGLFYEVTDEDKIVVEGGSIEIPEDAVCDFGNVKPLITEENHPKYILIRREYRRGATSYYKIPKDLDLEKCTFPSIRAFESFSLIYLNWEGDTMTGIEYGFRCDGVEYSPFYSEFDDGNSDFALYEYDEDKGRYMEVATTICDEE